MRKRFLSPALIFLFLVGFTSCQNQEPAQTQKPVEPQVQKTCDGECLKGFVDKYMDAMLAKAPSETLFSKECIFTENGVRLPLGEEGLWSSMVGKGAYKFYVPDIETQQIGFFGTAREEAQNEGDKPSPVAIALRLKIKDGLISEAEQLVVRPESNLLNPGAERGPSAAELIEKWVKSLAILTRFILRSYLRMNVRPVKR
jgi:hypothetical protein